LRRGLPLESGNRAPPHARLNAPAIPVWELVMSVLRIARAPLSCCALLLMSAVAAGPARAADAAHPLDMSTVLSQVAASSPMLAASGAMSDAARERIAPAGAWSAPMVEAGVVNVPTTGRFDADMMTMKMVGVEQKVPISGANALSRRAATHAYDAARWNTQRDRVNVFGDAWKTYADAYLAGLAADAADTHDQVMARMEDAARAKVASGRGRIGEVLTAQAERARRWPSWRRCAGATRSWRARRLPPRPNGSRPIPRARGTRRTACPIPRCARWPQAWRVTARVPTRCAACAGLIWT
jgi:hypothetical protein